MVTATKRKRALRGDQSAAFEENRTMGKEEADTKPSLATASASASSTPTITTNVLCLNMTFTKESNVTLEYGKEWQHRQRLLHLESLTRVNAYSCDLRAAKDKGVDGRHMQGNFDRRRWVECDLKRDFGEEIKFDQVFMDYYDLPTACKFLVLGGNAICFALADCSLIYSIFYRG